MVEEWRYGGSTNSNQVMVGVMMEEMEETQDQESQVVAVVLVEHGNQGQQPNANWSRFNLYIMDHQPLVQVVAGGQIFGHGQRILHLVVLVAVEIVHQVMHKQEAAIQEVVVDQEVKQEMDMEHREDRE